MMRTTWFFTAACLLGLCASLQSGADTGTDPTVRDRVFLVVYQPGPNWIEGKPVTEQPLREHGRFILSLHAEGRLVQAGPFTDGSGGAAIYRAEDLAAAEALVAEDPAVVSGIMTPTIHPWLLREWNYYLDRAHGASD